MSILKLPPPVVVRPARAVASERPGSATLLGNGPWDASTSTHPGASPASPEPMLVALPEANGGAAAAAISAGSGPPVSTPAPESARTVATSAKRADSALFRYEALRAYQLGQRLSTPLKVVPLSTSIVLATIGAALLVALGIATFGHIDLVARGRGTVRAREGVQPLLFETAGVVRAVRVHEGDVVHAGQVLVELDSTRLRASLIEAEEQLAAVRERTQREDSQAEKTYARDRAILQRRAQLTRSRLASQRASLAAIDRERTRYGGLAEEGLVAEKTLRETQALEQQETRALLALEDELARIDQQVSTIEQARAAGATQRAHELREAVNRRDTARVLLAQTELRAARAGRIESLGISEGDVIDPGRVVARLISLGHPRSATAFLPERERAFVRSGAEVRVEFDQLPVGEFGSARARVLRVSSEVASAQELERALGAAAPSGVHFAVSLEMANDARTDALLAKVGSGTLLTVRTPVRRRRIISLVFDPVRRWLD